VTRESKLALILSFVLILVVGVLISDHFSSAGSMIPDSLDEDQGVIAPLPGADRSGLDNAIDRVMPESDGSSARSLLEQMTESVRSMEVPALASEGEDIGLAPVEILNTSIPDREPEPVVREPVRRDARATYTVRAGDSLYRISVNTLGDGERWREIHELNRATLGADPVLQPGMVLELPSGARSSVVVTPRISEPAPTKKGRTHVVQSGDTLGEISQKYLGTVKRMNEIVKLNGLDDADDIRLGMTLKIPD
jgi:nucleoid-associated protein YgaU